MRTDPRGVEKLIQDAQQEGKFDDLSCKGQPLHVAFGDLASVANDVMRDNGVVPEWITLSREIEALRERRRELIVELVRRRAADRAELEQALTSWNTGERRQSHGWGRTIRRWWLGDHSYSRRKAPTPSALVDRIEQDRKRVLFQVAKLLRADRKKVDRYNLILAVGGRQMHRVRVEECLTEFLQRFPAFALIAENGAARVEERLDRLDPSLLAESDDAAPSRPSRAPEQAEALQTLRESARRPRPIG
jgi:DnaJ homologue, subfamily C, member 28, conserved domain